jgi:hypothetical protein
MPSIEVPEFIPRTVTLKAPLLGPFPLAWPLVPFVADEGADSIEGAIFEARRVFAQVRGVLLYKC